MTKSFQGIAHRPLRAVALLALGLMLVGALFAGRANAVLSPATFELDGNTLVNTAPAHDWSQVFDSGTFGAHGADKALFLPDFFPGADDQPATGATKDTNDIDGWNCKAAGLSPPKNDMGNAFVASYTVGGSQLIYFGLDRINSDNGNANVGFWFLKDNHDCDPSAGTTTWTGGKHAQGDTLVTSSFTGGGIVSTILIFEWCSDPAAPDLKCGDSNSIVVPTPGSGNGPLQLIFTGADCRNADGTPSVFATGLACATVNRTINTEAPPWPYSGAGSPSNTYERGALFEGGIDATGLGLDLQCAGTFVADTRSSQSPTAQLHDFSIGQVDLCQATVATTSSTTSSTVLPGTAVSDTATVTQTPASAPVPTGTVKFFLCQPATVTANGGDCSAGGTQIGTPVAGETLVAGSATSESTTNTTAIGRYCWRAEYSGDGRYAMGSHTNSTTECFTVFNPTTVISIADRIVGLPSDATGTVTYGVFTDSNCTTAVTTGVPSNGNITPSPNTVGAGGVAPLSLLYTPAAPGTFYIKATFSGTGSLAGVNVANCTESAVLTF